MEESMSSYGKFGTLFYSQILLISYFQQSVNAHMKSDVSKNWPKGCVWSLVLEYYYIILNPLISNPLVKRLPYRKWSE
jgi:hypothetical protein